MVIEANLYVVICRVSGLDSRNPDPTKAFLVNTYLDPDPGFDDHNFKYFTVFKKCNISIL
jgi:hypothetical protein